MTDSILILVTHTHYHLQGVKEQMSAVSESCIENSKFVWFLLYKIPF